MENNLQKWFAAAADAEPIIKVEEVGAMINTSPRSVRVKPTFKHFIIMGASLILVTSLVYWMNMPVEEMENAVVRKTSMQQYNKTEAKREQQLVWHKQARTKQVTSSTNISENKVTEKQVLPVDYIEQARVEEPLSNTIVFQNRTIYLTEKDFERLDIHFIKNGYNHYYKTYEYNHKIKATQLRSQNDSFYFAKGYPGKNYFIKPWESDYHPLFLTDSLGNHQQNFHFQDCLTNQSYSEFTDSLRNYFLASYHELIPIGIRASQFGKLHVLWYKPTRELLKRLPDQSSFAEHLNQSFNWDNKIGKGEYVYLTNEELANLGIKTDGNILYYKNINHPTKQKVNINNNIYESYSTFMIDVEEHGSMRISNGVLGKDSSTEKNGKTFWPAFVQVINKSDSSLNIAESFINPGADRDFYKESKKLLIPVFASTVANPSRYNSDRNYIFWFKPEEDFFNAVPPSIARNLRQEYPESNLAEYYKILSQYSIAVKSDELRKGFDSLRVLQLKERFVTLSSRDLKRLNIRKVRHGFIYSSSYKESGRINSVFIKKRGINQEVTFRKTSIKPLQIKMEDNLFKAAAITSHNIGDILYMYIHPDSIPYSKKQQEGFKRFDKEVSTLIPIVIDQSSVIWFYKTKELQHLIDEAEQKNASKSEVKETEINAIHYIELTNEELIKMGISKEDKWIKVPNISSSNYLFYGKYSKSGSEHEFDVSPNHMPTKPHQGEGVFIVPNSPTEKPYALRPSYPKETYPQPQLITDGTGLHWRMYQIEDDSTRPVLSGFYAKGKNIKNTVQEELLSKRAVNTDYILKRLNTLIAIRVRSNEGYDSKLERNSAVHPDLIIWYQPDSLFLSRLPVALAQQIRDELNHVQSNRNGYSCVYFEACTNVNGSISDYMLYPNPAEDKSSLSITLDDSRILTVVLTDISGKIVSSIVKQQLFNKGEYTLGFSVNELSDGMYLLRILTDKGEHITQRLIVKK